MTIKTLIVAGSARQASDWADSKDISPRNYIYVGNEHILRGRSTLGSPRHFIGTFSERRDAEQLLEHLAIADMRSHAPR